MLLQEQASSSHRPFLWGIHTEWRWQVGKKVASLIEGSTWASTQQRFFPCSQWAVCPSACTAAAAAANSGGLSNSQINSWQGLPWIRTRKLIPRPPHELKSNYWNVWSRSDREPTVNRNTQAVPMLWDQQSLMYIKHRTTPPPRMISPHFTGQDTPTHPLRLPHHIFERGAADCHQCYCLTWNLPCGLVGQRTLCMALKIESIWWLWKWWFFCRGACTTLLSNCMRKQWFNIKRGNVRHCSCVVDE